MSFTAICKADCARPSAPVISAPMRDRAIDSGAALFGLLLLAAAALQPQVAGAQETVFRPGVSGPNVEQYLREAGPDSKLIAHGELTIDGRAVNCGKRPTVLNDNFDSWGGAFPGFLILNVTKISGLSTAVKLYIYSHECGHQFIGPDETKADLFAIRRGVRWGWLDAVGMEDICTFISTLKGDAVHPPGPLRCETMRKYYRELIETDGTQAASAPAKPSSQQKAHTLAPE
jgi:hypothetical protein